MTFSSSLVEVRSSALVRPDSLLVLSSLIICVMYSCNREYKKRETSSGFVTATLSVIKEFHKANLKNLFVFYHPHSKKSHQGGR